MLKASLSISKNSFCKPPFVLYQVLLVLAAIPGIVAPIAPSKSAFPVLPPASTVPICNGVKGGKETGAPRREL